MQEKKKNDILHDISTVIFGVLAVWWGWIQLTQEPGGEIGGYFSDSYGILALVGGIFGLIASKKWGGYKSILGRAIVFFSLGLFLQAFGQAAYSYYAYILGVDAPYPSIGDVGYFGSIPLYILGVWNLGKAAGAKLSLRSYKNKLWAILVPAAILFISYFIFLKDYSVCPVDEETMEAVCSTPVQVFLDFGYPLGQAIYVSVAMLVYFLSKKLLGGIMRTKILLVLFALTVQYIADFIFLYQNSRDTWVPGGVNDFTYLVAYIIMITALLRMRHLDLKTPQQEPEAEKQ